MYFYITKTEKLGMVIEIKLKDKQYSIFLMLHKNNIV
jgi:hypothetical protein